MNRPPDFSEIVGGDVPAAERGRLERIHDLLVAVGPPPELPPALERPPTPRDRVPESPSRRRGAVLALAAALAAAAFGAGFLVGDRGREQAGVPPFQTDFTLKMQGTQAAPSAVASLVVGELDDDGNWPMQMTVRGLPELPAGQRYELRLTKGGKAGPSCGVFKVTSDKGVVFLNAPYKLKRYDGWAITRQGSDEILVRTAEI